MVKNFAKFHSLYDKKFGIDASEDAQIFGDYVNENQDSDEISVKKLADSGDLNNAGSELLN